MLQVARLAPRQLGESRDLVAAFLRSHLDAGGGFHDRAGAGDLYYTVFALDALIALQEEVPAETAGFLLACAGRPGLDLVGLSCLARGWAALRQPPPAEVRSRILEGLDACRSGDGGFAPAPGAPHGTAYAAFLALGAYEDLAVPLPGPERVVESLRALRVPDGSYGNLPGASVGLTTTTAAAVMVNRHLEGPPDREAGMWLLDRCHPRGGFFASPSTPMPDLLSTATALHALSALHLPIAGLREPCLDFVDSLWTNRGGFYGSWADDEVDVEYTYYGLLALGHLSLE
jgi:hypothetical protein